jgi:hypothetical protein
MAKKIKVVVCVEGGVVCGAYSNNKAVELEVWDWDDREESADENNMELLSDEFKKLTKGFEVIL